MTRHGTDDLYERLAARLGAEMLAKRLSVQVEHAAAWFGGPGFGRLHLENLPLALKLLKAGLRLSGLSRRARLNCLEIACQKLETRLPGLDPAFSGYRILHLSDLHFDGLPDRGETARRMASDISCDLCVITGDFRFASQGDLDAGMEPAGRLIASLDPADGVYCVLGNHDAVEMVEPLERAGARVLVNEGLELGRGKARLWLCGVDDSHFFGTHDLGRALAGRGKTPAIMLSHSRETAAAAARLGVSLFLCGHCHGGQICLPGGFAPVTNCRAPRRLTAGKWRLGGMQGYTTRGVGVSGVAARLNCPPEIVLHEIRVA